MLKKPFMTIEQENGKIDIYGNNHWIPIEGQIQDDGHPSECFRYKGNVYRICDFIVVDKNSPFFKDHRFHGYISDTFFSGVIIELSVDGDAVKAFTYLS